MYFLFSSSWCLLLFEHTSVHFRLMLSLMSASSFLAIPCSFCSTIRLTCLRSIFFFISSLAASHMLWCCASHNGSRCRRCCCCYCCCCCLYVIYLSPKMKHRNSFTACSVLISVKIELQLHQYVYRSTPMTLVIWWHSKCTNTCLHEHSLARQRTAFLRSCLSNNQSMVGILIVLL